MHQPDKVSPSQAYESCRKCDFDIQTQQCLHGHDFGPFAQTDANGGPQGLGEFCSQALYGGTYMSVFGALVWRTNVSTVLQLDIGAFDYHRANFSSDRRAGRVSAEFLLWNPHNGSEVAVAFNRSALGPGFGKGGGVELAVRGEPRRRVSCAVSSGECAVSLGADEAVVLVATPAGSLRLDGGSDAEG